MSRRCDTTVRWRMSPKQATLRLHHGIAEVRVMIDGDVSPVRHKQATCQDQAGMRVSVPIRAENKEPCGFRAGLLGNRLGTRLLRQPTSENNEPLE